MKAALMRAYHQPLEFVERPMPEIAHPGDVVVRIGGTFVTPPPSSGILPGTTQLALWARLEEQGLPHEYRMLTPEDVLDAEAAWLLSSVRLAAPVRGVDGRPLPMDAGLTAQINDALRSRTD